MTLSQFSSQPMNSLVMVLALPLVLWRWLLLRGTTVPRLLNYEATLYPWITGQVLLWLATLKLLGTRTLSWCELIKRDRCNGLDYLEKLGMNM